MRSNWVEQLVLPLAVAVLEATWLSRLLMAFTRGLAPDHPIATGLPIWSMLAMVLAAAFTGRVLLNAPLTIQRVRQLSVIFGVLGIGLGLWAGFGLGRMPWHLGWFFEFLRSLSVGTWGVGLPLQMFALLAAIYLWWRGLLAGRSDLPYRHLYRTFVVGIVALILMAILATATQLLSGPDLVLPLVVYFAVALGSLALASIERARRHGLAVTGVWLTLNQYWASTVGGAIGLVIFTGLSIGWLLAPATLTSIFAPIAGLVLLLIVAGFYVLGLIAGYFIGLLQTNPLLAEWLEGLFMVWQGAQIDPLINLNTPENIAQLLAESLSEFARQSPIVQFSSRTLAILMLTSVIVGLFWFVMRRLNHLPRATIEEQRETILTRALVGKQLRAVLRDWLSNRKPPPSYLPLPNDPDPRFAIRQAYQALLSWAASQGHSRQRFHTPLRYAAHLSQLYPQAQSAIAELTDSYLIARYGQQPPTPDQAQTALKALRTVQALRNNGTRK